MENIKDTNVDTEQVSNNSQEDIDNAVASAKARWNKKLEKDYVSVEKYNEVVEQLANATRELKLPKIRETLSKAGVKDVAVNDFIKLNPNLVDMEEKDIAKLLENAKKNSSYMFNESSFNATVGNANVQTNKVDIDISNGSLLRH